MQTASWTLAERTCFKFLLDKCGGAEGRTAFLGYLPPVPNAWAINTGGGPGGDELETTDPDGIHLDVEVVGRFTKRATAQEFWLAAITAQILEGTETGSENVRLFRMRDGAAPALEMVAIQLANQEHKTWIYQISFGMELHFDTDYDGVPDP
jgi:hypothetical protein